MSSNTRSATEIAPGSSPPAATTAEAPVAEERVAGKPSAGELVELVECVRGADRLVARAVLLAGRLAGSGVCEREEGLPLEHFLGLAARLTGGDRRTLVGAGETLQDLPAVARLFADGMLSWGQVRVVHFAARGLSKAERELLDERVAATAAAYEEGIEAFDPDGFVWAVDEAVAELRPALSERNERRAAASTFLSRQMRFDGGMRVYGEFDALTSATVNAAIDQFGGPVPTDGDAGRDDAAATMDGDGDVVPVGRWTAGEQAQADAAALVGLCAEWLGGGAGRPARPLFVAHVDVAAGAEGAAGTVEVGLRGDLPRISAATLEALAEDADVRAVLFEGARPLTVTGKVRARDVPAETRFAVQARDRGDRFPGSQDPLRHADVHHLLDRAKQGDHNPDNLACVSRRWHTVVHKQGWTLTLDPATGMLTAARGRRRWHSMPKGTGLVRVPAGGVREGPDRPAREPPGRRAPPDDSGASPDPTMPF